jgi:hypothetical protein
MWLAEEVARLPLGNARNSSLKLLDTETAIAQLHRDHPRNWRAKRASVMIHGTKKTK